METIQVIKIPRRKRSKISMTRKEISRFRLEAILSVYDEDRQQKIIKSSFICPFESLIDIASEIFGVDKLKILSDNDKIGSRKRNLVYARMFVAVYLKRNIGYSLSKIGTLLGHRDHATIIHYISKYDSFIFIKDDFIVTTTKEFVCRINDLGCNYKTAMSL